MARRGYVQLVNGFYTNDKVQELCRSGHMDAIGAFCMALTYCGDHLTDGFIPRRTMRFAAAKSWAPITSPVLTAATVWWTSWRSWGAWHGDRPARPATGLGGNRGSIGRDGKTTLWLRMGEHSR